SAVYLPGATASNQEQRRRLAPGVFQSIYLQESIGTADYNALQTVVRYRFHRGLTLLSSYTWSHSIDTCSQSAAGGNCFMDPNNHPGQYGNLGRNVLTAPGNFNSDLGLYKHFNITEHKRLVFRAEFFNAFNQTHLNAPISTLISPAFGQITSAGDPRLIQLAMK